MAHGGYCIQPVQRRSAQQDVVGGIGVYDQVPDAFGTRGRSICERCPQFQVASYFHLVVSKPL